MPEAAASGMEASPALGRLRILLSLLLILQALGSFLPGPLLWGVNHLAYLPMFLGLPMVLKLLWPALGLALIWTPVGALLGRWLISKAGPLLLGRRWVAYGVVPLVGAFLFWLLRCRIHFLGDGWLLGESVARGLLFHGFDFVDYHLHAKLFSLLPLSTEAEAFRLFAIMSVIVGAFYLASVAWVARALSRDWGERVLLYALLVFFAPIEMFMGYVECYSFLAVFMLLFLAAVAAHYRWGLSSFWAATAFGVGLAFHLDALFLAPMLLPLILWPSKDEGSSVLKRAFSVGAPVLALFALAVVFLLLEGYNQTWFAIEFIKVPRSHRLIVPLLGEHGLFSGTHLKDFINLLLLLAPVPLVMICAALRRGLRSRPLSREALAFLVGCVWLMALLLLIHMRLGMARDWDLFAAQAVVFVFAAFAIWSRLSGGKPEPRLVGMVVIAAFFLAAPWFAVNAGEERSLERFRGVVAGLPKFSRAYAHEEIGKYFRKKDMTPEALEEYRICVETFPGNPRFHGVLGALEYNSGDHEAAFETFRRAYGVDSTYALALEMLAQLYGEKRDFESALIYSRKLAGQPREKARAAIVHAAVAEKLGLTREAIDAYTRAMTKDRTRVDLLERIGALLFVTEDYREAERAFRGALSKKPTTSAQIGLVAALWEPLRRDPARRGTPQAQARLKEALGLIDDLLAQGETGRDLSRWREDIRAALAGR